MGVVYEIAGGDEIFTVRAYANLIFPVHQLFQSNLMSVQMSSVV
jgi:hypothetical protein